MLKGGPLSSTSASVLARSALCAFDDHLWTAEAFGGMLIRFLSEGEGGGCSSCLSTFLRSCEPGKLAFFTMGSSSPPSALFELACAMPPLCWLGPSVASARRSSGSFGESTWERAASTCCVLERPAPDDCAERQTPVQ